MGSYRKIKEELAKRGGADRVKMGFLLQSILGHWPRVDKKIELWQRSVNEDGEVERFCVLDERFRDYIRKVGAALAAERPCFILIIDQPSCFKCMNVLIDGVGPVDAERFISIVNREHFDYTEWQKGLFAGETVQSLGEKVMSYDPAVEIEVR